MIDLGCLSLRYLSDSGLFVRRPLRVLLGRCPFTDLLNFIARLGCLLRRDFCALKSILVSILFRGPHLDSTVMDSLLLCTPHLTLLHHLNLVCFLDVTLDFILSFILHRFLVVFLLLLRKLMRVCCQLPSCPVVPLSLPEKRLARLPPSSFSPHLFPTSDSVRSFPVTSGSVTAERCGGRCRFCLRLCRSLRFAFRHRICLAFGDRSFTVSDFDPFPSSSRSSMLFSPAVGSALLLPAVGFALVLPAVGHALLLPVVGSVLVLPVLAFCWPCSCLDCCWLCSCLACCWLCSSRFFSSSLQIFVFFSLSSYPCCFTSSFSPQARWLRFLVCFFF